MSYIEASTKRFFLSIKVFFQEHSRITGLQGKRESIFFNFSLPLPPTVLHIRFRSLSNNFKWQLGALAQVLQQYAIHGRMVDLKLQ